MKILSCFDGKYDVCENGEIFSNVGKRKKIIGKISKAGYRMVVLTINGKKTYKNVHRLVAELFIENISGLTQVNHKDGDKINNNVSNLEWITPKGNLLHARDNSLLSTNKINMNIANSIRKLYSTGIHSHRKIAAMFNIKKTEVGYIINNKRWCI